MFGKNISLKQYSNYKIGGPAKHFAEVDTIDEIEKVLSKNKEKVFILGGGTNVLFGDDVFEGLVIKSNFKNLEREDKIIRVGSGVLMGELVQFAADEGLGGLEWAAGLPGTVGGAIYGNAGAFGGEMKDIIESVISLDISGSKPRIIERENNECNFQYRSSIFKENPNGEIILEAKIILSKGDKEQIQEAIEDKINYRLERQPLEYPNIGSIFKNVVVSGVNPDYIREDFPIKIDPFPVIPTAYLISECGLKGISCGGAMISPKHPNFIVNILDANSKDVKNLIQLVKNEVKNKFNLGLEEEVIIL